MIKLNYINDAVNFQKIDCILVVKLQLLGDVLLTTPLYSVIKQQFPHIKIDVLVYKETALILSGNLDINQVHQIDREWKKQGLFVQLDKEYGLVKQLKAKKYDLIINLTDRWRGGGLVRLLKPKYSVSRAYQHRRGKLWHNIFTHIYSIPQKNRHTVEANLDAIRRLGVNLQERDKKLTFEVSPASEQRAQGIFEKYQLNDKKIIVIHPTSRWMFKAWNPKAFSRVVDLLAENGFSIILISGPQPDEIEYVESIRMASKKDVLDLAGQLSINECAALIKHAKCFVGLDSVAMHIAAAVNTPCAAIFGPTRDRNWHPWGVKHQVITENFDCRPCGLKGCGDGMRSECIQAITPETVFQAVISLVKK